MKRRQFLQQSSLLAGASFLSSLPTYGFPSLARNVRRNIPLDLNASPIQNCESLFSTEFNGDSPDVPHQVLWDKWNFLKSQGGIPAPQEKFSRVVVGGGIAGLLSAYYLRDQKTLLLDCAHHFGGNSRGEISQGTRYTIGAAYLTIPDEGDENDLLLRELSLWDEIRKEEESHVLFRGQKIQGFWQGATDPQNRHQFTEVSERLRDIYENSYPEIPLAADEENQQFVRVLDEMTFLAWLQREFTSVHPHILEYFQLYAWSSFGGNINEISAAQMLNFVCSEVDGVLTLPGGNARISEKIFEALGQSPSVTMRPRCLVIDVNDRGSDVQITYLDGNGVLQSILADECIFAAPKMLLPKLVDDCPQEIYQAVRQISYRPYIVGNLILERRLDLEQYELYCLQGSVPQNPTNTQTSGRGFTDIVSSSFTQDGKTVLSLFKPLPVHGIHQTLFNPWAHDKIKEQIIQYLKTCQAEFDLRDDELQNLRLTRFGHALPQAARGMIASNALAVLQRPYGRLRFVGQDVWVNPSFEAAHASVIQALRGTA